MIKILLTMVVGIFLSGCSKFTINGTMCDRIASEPNAIMPQECRAYNKEEAQKAFDKTRENKKVSKEDIEFHKESN